MTIFVKKCAMFAENIISQPGKLYFINEHFLVHLIIERLTKG
jgi:hypothetical protein